MSIKYTYFEEFRNSDDYNQFIVDNPDIGYLNIKVFTAYEAIPLGNTSIVITKRINDKNVVFFEGVTDSSGIINNINLPAPKMIDDISSEVALKYTTYEIMAGHDNYEIYKKLELGMFGGISVIQYIKMVPEEMANEY